MTYINIIYITSTTNLEDKRIYIIFLDFLSKNFSDHFPAPHFCICVQIQIFTICSKEKFRISKLKIQNYQPPCTIATPWIQEVNLTYLRRSVYHIKIKKPY